MEEYLRNLGRVEWDYARPVQDAIAEVQRELRHEWTEPVEPEHATWRRLSLALFALNERCVAQGRPGIRWVEDTESPFDFEGMDSITGGAVETILADNVPNWGSGVWRIPLDGTYHVVSEDDLAKLIGWDWTDRRTYVKDLWDCENFAMAFKTNADRLLLNCVGLVIDWSSAHAYNVIVFKDGLWFFEPQNDTIPEVGSGNYKMEKAVIIL